MYNQNNSMALREYLGKEIGAIIQHEKYFDFIHAKDTSWPKIMFNIRLKVNEIDDFVEKVTVGVRQGRYPETFVTEISEQGGFVLTELEKRDIKRRHWTVMHHDLKTVDSFNYPVNFEIIRVENENQLADWMRICETELMKATMDARLFTNKFKDENMLLFLGVSNGKPVSTSLIYYQNKESGLYFISADGENRGKGFGKAITHHAILQAKERKCEIMYLEATDDGLPVYESLGFKNNGRALLFNFAKKRDEE
jgi:ribosomal protein S18 acetylase RimI-like enzyme